MGKALNLTGKRFGRLIAIRYAFSKNKYRYWECQCDCGAKCHVMASSLSLKNTQSCGCWKRERTKRGGKTHGQSRTPTYRSWKAMLARCCNRHVNNYKNYGGRGIEVCERWRHSFTAFLSDMGERPSGTTLDRIDNNRNYEPGNCRWADATTQSRNARSNVRITFRGQTKILSEWASAIGISASALKNRLKKWTAEDAFMLPRKVTHWMDLPEAPRGAKAAKGVA